MKNAKHILKTALFCGVIALLPLVSVLGPRENTSFYENRTLAAFPAFSRASLLDGSFFSGAEDYISDHIAFRIPLLRLNVPFFHFFRLPIMHSQLHRRVC